MRTWLGSILFVVLATFAVASGCGGTPEVPRGGGPDLDASVGGGSSGSNGTGANGGGFVLGHGDGGEAGENDGCHSSCAALNANCGYVTDTICGGLVECGDCPTG